MFGKAFPFFLTKPRFLKKSLFLANRVFFSESRNYHHYLFYTFFLFTASLSPFFMRNQFLLIPISELAGGGRAPLSACIFHTLPCNKAKGHASLSRMLKKRGEGFSQGEGGREGERERERVYTTGSKKVPVLRYTFLPHLIFIPSPQVRREKSVPICGAISLRARPLPQASRNGPSHPFLPSLCC